MSENGAGHAPIHAPTPAAIAGLANVPGLEASAHVIRALREAVALAAKICAGAAARRKQGKVMADIRK